MTTASRAVLVAIGWAGAVSCGPTTRKLDEAVLYQGPAFKLKLARYYENLPLHYTGEVFRVQCASAGTAASPAHATQDSGWVTLGNGGAIGSRNAAELVERERRNYLVFDRETLVWLGNGLNVSFDACTQFRGWYPTSLPESLIDPADKPPYCAPQGTVDCRSYDFLGDREARFDSIRVEHDGTVSFVVRTRALKHDRALRVESADSGRTWSVESL